MSTGLLEVTATVIKGFLGPLRTLLYRREGYFTGYHELTQWQLTGSARAPRERSKGDIGKTWLVSRQVVEPDPTQISRTPPSSNKP